MDQSATATLTRPSAPVSRAGSGLWRRYVTDVRVAADAESDAYRAVTPAAVADRRVAAVLVATALCLTCAEFLDELPGRGHSQFAQLAYWAVVQIACYVLVPVLVIRLVLRARVRDFGLRVRGMRSHAGLYLALLAIAVPAVVLASYGSAFQDRYPFYDLGVDESFWPRLWAWWALYSLQFVALEFFFRGFLVQGLAPRLGYAAIFVMIVPYNMIHYGKPMAEALAAIVGGAVLGTLSLKTRSIWWGAALHISVAATMDVLALSHEGVLF